MSDETYVLDASALLCFLRGEAGADVVRPIMPQALISSVNLAETAAKLQEHGLPDAELDLTLSELNLLVKDFTAAQAAQSGKLRKMTKRFGLSLGDRACLALAIAENAIAVTADRAWQKPGLGVQIRLVR